MILRYRSAEGNAVDSEELSYSYLGGGVQYDPPNTYGLVSKYMPLTMGDIFAACVLFLAESQVEQGFFVRKYYLQITQIASPKEKTDAITARHKEVDRWLQKLKTRYVSSVQLLKHYGMHQ